MMKKKSYLLGFDPCKCPLLRTHPNPNGRARRDINTKRGQAQGECDQPAATAVAAQSRGTEAPWEARQDSLDYARTD